jgi:hypothetical protein
MLIDAKFESVSNSGGMTEYLHGTVGTWNHAPVNAHLHKSERQKTHQQAYNAATGAGLETALWLKFHN